jgi:hypothetical protein
LGNSNSVHRQVFTIRASARLQILLAVLVPHAVPVGEGEEEEEEELSNSRISGHAY